MPLSRTRTDTRFPSPRTVTEMCVAPECLAALVTASETTKYAAVSTGLGSGTARANSMRSGITHRSATPPSASSRPRLSSADG